MSNEAEPNEKKPRERAPGYVAARYHKELGRLEASIATAKITVREKTEELTKLTTALKAEPKVVQDLVAGMLKASAGNGSGAKAAEAPKDAPAEK